MSQASSRPFEGVVTPEAVVLDFQTAGIGSRTAAAFIDFFIRAVLLFIFFAGAGIMNAVTGSPLPTWAVVTLFTLLIFIVLVGYPAIFETLWNGKTPGKAAFGLRVTTVEGAPIRFRHAAIRAALGFFEITITYGLVGWIAMFASKREQRLGDMAAGTLVLRERRARSTPAPVAFAPVPGTEDYTATLDVSSLTSQDYINVRSYLTRAYNMRPEARYAVSTQLAEPLAQRLRTVPPSWMTAEVFLVSVAAAYQRRFAPPVTGYE